MCAGTIGVHRTVPPPTAAARSASLAYNHPWPKSLRTPQRPFSPDGGHRQQHTRLYPWVGPIGNHLTLARAFG